MGSWSRKMTWTWPFRKAAKTTTTTTTRPTAAAAPLVDSNNNSQQPQGNNHHVKILHGEVMACGYEDVHVMWSILDKSSQTNHPRPS